MVLYGDLPRFYGDFRCWNVFKERLDSFFEIENTPNEKRRAVLITCISADVYKTLRSVCHPALPKEKTYDELCSNA